MTFHHNVKKNLFHISTNIPAFFRYIGWPEGSETDIVASTASISGGNSSTVFVDHTS